MRVHLSVRRRLRLGLFSGTDRERQAGASGGPFRSISRSLLRFIGQGAVVPNRPVTFLQEPPIEEPAVGKPGEFVFGGQPFQLAPLPPIDALGMETPHPGRHTGRMSGATASEGPVGKAGRRFPGPARRRRSLPTPPGASFGKCNWDESWLNGSPRMRTFWTDCIAPARQSEVLLKDSFLTCGRFQRPGTGSFDEISL